MKLLDKVRKLCYPAYIYLVISVFSIIVLMFQNAGNTNRYCVGTFSCNTPNTGLIFILKGAYVIFWTFILNLLCKNGFKNIAWFLVLLPYLLFFVLLGLLMMMSPSNVQMVANEREVVIY